MHEIKNNQEKVKNKWIQIIIIIIITIIIIVIIIIIITIICLGGEK